MQIHQNFVPNIFVHQISQIFVDLFAKNMNGWSGNSEIWCVEQWGRAEKKLENKNFTWAAVLGANISQIFSSPFSSENIFWNIWSLALGFLMRHSTRPQTSHCSHCYQIVTGGDYGKSFWNIYWKWNWTQIPTQIFCLK